MPEHAHRTVAEPELTDCPFQHHVTVGQMSMMTQLNSTQKVFDLGSSRHSCTTKHRRGYSAIHTHTCTYCFRETSGRGDNT